MLSFYGALSEIMKGKKITCELWRKRGLYIYKNKDDELELIGPDGNIKITVSELQGWLIGYSFEVLEENNEIQS